MATLEDLQTQVDALSAGQAEAKADAARHEARTAEAVGLMQALKAKIEELASRPGLITQEQLDALVAQASAAVAQMGEADAQRDAADATLAQGVADNAPTA